MLHLKANSKEVLPPPDEHTGYPVPGNGLFFPPRSEAILRVITGGSLPSLAQPWFQVTSKTKRRIHKEPRQLCLASQEGQTTARCFDGHTWPWEPFLLGSACHILGDGQAQVPRTEVSPRATSNTNLLQSPTHRKGGGSLTCPSFPKHSTWHLASREGMAWFA